MRPNTFYPAIHEVDLWQVYGADHSSAILDSKSQNSLLDSNQVTSRECRNGSLEQLSRFSVFPHRPSRVTLATTVMKGIDRSIGWHRPLKMASTVYDPEICVGATSSTREELNQFITAVNSFHPALKYTWEISDSSLAFLDIKLSIEGNGLCTSVHYKPTDSHSYLLYSSSHPSHVKNSIPYSQLLRLRRLCSEDSDFSLKSEEMCHFFDKRGYPASVVQAGHHRAQQIDRQSALQTSQKENNNRIPFTLTFHPHNHAVKSIILKNFKLLQNDPDTGVIFSQPPLISFKRDKNIGNFLVRSAFQTSNQAGTFKCARARCKTCPFICNVEKLSGPKRSIKITDHFTCTSTNVIYCITCTLCKKLYIGETGRRLGDRFREHLRDVEKDDKNASKPVARHFNLPNHSKQHMVVCGLSLHQGSTESRKTQEQKFIFQIGTLNPHGINERFSFN